MDEEAKKEALKNLESEHVLNKTRYEDMTIAIAKLKDDQLVSEKIQDLLIANPRKLIPTYKFEELPEYWELISKKQGFKKHYEKEQIKMQVNRLQKTIDQTKKLIDDHESNVEKTKKEFIELSEKPEVKVE